MNYHMILYLTYSEKDNSPIEFSKILLGTKSEIIQNY